MPRNDRSDSLSVRSPDDPRKPVKALEQEAEKELLAEEASRTGGSDHRTGGPRWAAAPRDGRRSDEEAYAEEVRRATDEQDRDAPRGAGKGTGPGPE